MAEQLLRWYPAHKRDLPWRSRESDAYAQLVAELMLQQTQVATVIPYFERFLARFPTVQALADAPLDEVLALWSGLGYYRRARHLHAAAQRVMREHGGRLPETVDGLMHLPGIGRYTAGAIASIAFGARAPVLDGNAARVLLRLTAMREDPQASSTRSALWTLAESLLPRQRCGDFNQALMELGATVCLPQGPACRVCPLRDLCEAFRLQLADCIPSPSKRTKILPAAYVVAAVRSGEELLFEQRPASGLWAGLWELPSEALRAGEALERARDRLRRRLPVGTRLSRVPVGSLVRQLTHREVTFHLCTGRLAARRRDGRASRAVGCTAQTHEGRGDHQGSNGRAARRWVRPDRTAGMGISRACEAILRLVDVNSRQGSV